MSSAKVPRTLLIIVFFSLLLSACSTGRMIETSLYFGLAKPDGGQVTEEEWNRFKEERLAAVLKDGSTVFRAVGNWYDSDARKLITEPTYVVVYFYKNSKAHSLRIDSLRNVYKTLFQQQSVLRVDKKVTAKF